MPGHSRGTSLASRPVIGDAKDPRPFRPSGLDDAVRKVNVGSYLQAVNNVRRYELFLPCWLSEDIQVGTFFLCDWPTSADQG